jgi:hypothetical protein
VPLEDSIGALVQLQREGKVHHIGISNVEVSELHAARRVANIVAVQNRYRGQAAGLSRFRLQPSALFPRRLLARPAEAAQVAPGGSASQGRLVFAGASQAPPFGRTRGFHARLPIPATHR